MPSNYLVLVGSNNIAGADTYGTGFLVSRNNTYYVVTCRHVIREAANRNLFAIPKPKKTKNPPGGYPIFHLGNPQFHPQDNKVGTFDIAILEILGANRQSLNENEIIPFDIMNAQIVSNFQVGDEFLSEGYPIDYAELALSENKNEPLLPKQIRGFLRNIPLQGIPQYGFDAPLREAFFAQTSNENATGKGMSGGIVYTLNGDKIAGVLLGGGNFILTCQGQETNQFQGFFFANVSRIIEIMAA